MKEYDLIKYLLLDINDAVANDVDVRTIGGDQPANPPEIVVSWDATRLSNYNGHRAYGGDIEDSNGNKIGREYHAYYLLDLDILVRHEDEFERDKMIDTIRTAFVPYEDRPRSFNADTAEWSVGIDGPRDNSFVEPDWYEAGVPVSMVYLTRAEVTDSGSVPDTIDTIDIAVNSRDLVIADGDVRTVPSGSVRYFRTIEVNGEYEVDGTVYTRSLTISGTGSVTGSGEIIETDQPYSEIKQSTSEVIN